MTTTSASMNVPGDGTVCDPTTDESTPQHRPNNDNTRSGERSERWTPEPQPATFGTLTEWGRKHLGEEWATNRETMIDDVYNSITANEPTLSKKYCDRQQALRDMERQLQRDKVEPLARNLEELTSLARKRYGERWYLNRRAARRERELARVDSLAEEHGESWQERRKHLIRASKRKNMASDIRRTRDETMLSEGYSWDQILGSSQPPNDTADVETYTPPMSEVGSDFEDEAAPSNESEYAKQAKEGPRSPLERLGWKAVAEDWDNEKYELAVWSVFAAKRSRAENEECIRRCDAEDREAKRKRKEKNAHFFWMEGQAQMMLVRMLNEEHKDEHRLDQRAAWRLASVRLDELRGGDWTKLPDLELIAQSGGMRNPPSSPSPSLGQDGVSPGSGQEPTASPKQQQRKRPGSPQHHERRQSRRLRQLPVEYEAQDPDKIIRLANAARRRGL
ncbi:unnamed protein product [Clonostachys rosea]|uniref:Uncharacterized protein n=1 Tax=Bionectria ochroleuca TaxID=29856 RepID=A0ABY6UME1_BIOOC|nr:unnamed protein product [Clonostachys rosea]